MYGGLIQRELCLQRPFATKQCQHLTVKQEKTPKPPPHIGHIKSKCVWPKGYKATNVTLSVEWLPLSTTKWALCWQGQQVTYLSYCSENNLSAHHLDTVDKIIVPSSVRWKVPGIWGSSNMRHDTFLLKLSLTALTVVENALKVVVTFHDIDCFFQIFLAAWGVHIAFVINH